MKYWRTILCASALGACGLGVWANDCVRGNSAKKEATPVAAAEPAPAPTAAADPESPPVNVIMDVGAPMPPPNGPAVAPPAIPAFPDPLVQKAGASNPEPESPKLALPSDPPPLPAAKLETPPSPLGLEPPPAIPRPSPAAPSKHDAPAPSPELPKAPLPSDLPKSPIPMNKPIDLPTAPAPAAPKLDFPSPPPPAPASAATPAPIAPAVNVPATSEPPMAAAPASGPFKMFLRMGGSSQPRFEVKDGDAMILKVYFDHVDLHAGNQGLTAKGNVRLHGSGLDGTCDQLSLSSTKGEVELKGNIRLNCYRGGASTMVSADQMKFQLKGATEPTKSHKTATVPASWSGKR